MSNQRLSRLFVRFDGRARDAIHAAPSYRDATASISRSAAALTGLTR